MDCNEGEVSILFTDDKQISQLNKRYRGKDGPTNVLAFPMSDPGSPETNWGMLGDIVISLDRAVQESKDLGESLEETLYRLLIHGLLHLLGFDHVRSSEEERRMNEEETRLLRLIDMEKPNSQKEG
ncbi:MAG: rRNA maturation RNase YbeY [Deltaproteobacteria bacterium]|nr:rRNA maturation RNase YbeY [Deltaproteobacteria bacterium]